MVVRIGFGVGLADGHDDADRFAALVDGLEELGFDSLWLPERLTGPRPDPVVGLAVAAGRTRRLKLGTSVLVLPGRNPALLAGELATLDRLSGGRLLPAFGLGLADEQEHQAFGVRRERRGALFDETLELVRRFWTGEPVDHAGDAFHYAGVAVGPTPVQSPPEVWLGGDADRELRRVGRLGEGWLPSFTTPERAARGRAVVDEAAAAAGRAIDPGHFGALVTYAREALPQRLAAAARRRRPDLDPADVVPVGLPALHDRLQAFVAAGFTKLVVVPAVAPDDWRRELEDLAAAVLPLQR